MINEVLADRGFARIEYADSDAACVTLVEGAMPDIVIVDADMRGMKVSWLTDLCGVRDVPVMIVTADRFAGSPNPAIVVLRKPFMKQQLSLAIDEAFERNGAMDHDGLSGTGRIMRRD